MHFGKPRVLHFSPHGERCGIADYQELFLMRLNESGNTKNEFFEISPYQTRNMTPDKFGLTLDKFKDELRKFDILHVQHEFELFPGNQFSRIIDAALGLSKSLVVTAHSTRNISDEQARLRGFSPRAVSNLIKETSARNKFIKNHLVPFRKANIVIIHNQTAADRLMQAGVVKDRIYKLTYPVPDIITKKTSSELRSRLCKNDEDVLVGCIGFIGRQKGITEAIRALKFLPANYKLAVIGGLHQLSPDQNYINEIADLIVSLDLIERVYITGYIKDSENLHALIRECNVCVYPYSASTYSNASSASLASALANHRPVIAYPTPSFAEIAKETDAIVLCEAFSYYELAREIQRINFVEQSARVAQYANYMSWSKKAFEVEKIYLNLKGLHLMTS